MRKTQAIVVILAFSLLMQNTCPRGFAGKTAIAAVCGHCPLTQTIVPSHDEQKKFVSAKPSCHFPLFLFAVQDSIHTLQLEPVESAPPLLAESYADALPDELLRPPRV